MTELVKTTAQANRRGTEQIRGINIHLKQDSSYKLSLGSGANYKAADKEKEGLVTARVKALACPAKHVHHLKHTPHFH